MPRPKTKSIPTEAETPVSSAARSVHDGFEDMHPERANERLSHEQESHGAEEIHERYNDQWEPKGVLDTESFPARPGFAQMWVRTKIGNEDDVANIGRRMNEGWRPRLKETVKAGFVPTVMFEDSEVIGIRGMVLMERPLALHESQQAYIRKTADDMQRASDENMFAVHERGSGFGRPVAERSTRVSTGRRPAHVADD